MKWDAQRKKAARNLAVYLVNKIMETHSCSRDEALEILMKTSVYEALMEPDTELYLESREAVFDLLNKELSGNPLGLLEV